MKYQIAMKIINYAAMYGIDEALAQFLAMDLFMQVVLTIILGPFLIAAGIFILMIIGAGIQILAQGLFS